MRVNSNKRTMVARDAQFRATDTDGSLSIDGYFAVFNETYQIWDGITESIGRNAFDNSLSSDVRALTNHDTTLVLGRTSSGTLDLTVDDVGLRGSIKINPDDSDAVNLYNRVKRGDVSQCSFGFQILSETMESKDGNHHWTIDEVRLFEVSVVTFPAYETTSVSARSKEISQKRHDAWQKTAKERLKKWH